jgi:hypothetical protein
MTEDEREGAIRLAYDVFKEDLPLNVEQWERRSLFWHVLWRVQHQLPDPGWLISEALSGWRPARRRRGKKGWQVPQAWQTCKDHLHA